MKGNLIDPMACEQMLEIPVPGGDIIELYSQRGFVVQQLPMGVNRVQATLREIRASDFMGEAFAHEMRKDSDPAFVAQVDRSSLGIHAEHPLRALRDRLRTSVEATRRTTPDVVLWLWGASVNKGPTLYRELGTLLRAGWLEPHVASHPEWYGQRDAADLAMEWVYASGVRNDKALHAAAKLIQDHYLNRRPTATFSKLDYSMMRFATDVASGDRLLALLFFQCLQRIEARKFRDLIRWRSAWLRGPAVGGVDAIPGASTNGARLTALLNQHVLRRIEGHSAGRKAATYALRLALQRGDFSHWDMARHVGIVLDGAEPSPLTGLVDERRDH